MRITWKILLVVILANFALQAFAQTGDFTGSTEITVNINDPVDSVEPLGDDAANENIGQAIIDWIMRGADFDDPQSTLFGALSFVLNGLCYALATIIVAYNGAMYAIFTAQHGAPGGGKIQGMMNVVRTTTGYGMLIPIIGNGFSPVQASVKEFAEVGTYFGDQGLERVISFLSTDGPVVEPTRMGVADVVWQVYLSSACHETIDAYFERDKQLSSSGQSPHQTYISLKKSEGSITYSWDYMPPQITTRLGMIFGPKEQTGVCGSITVDLPDELEDHIDVDEDFIQNGYEGAIKYNPPSADDSTKIFFETAKLQIDALEALIISAKDKTSYLFDDQYMLQQASAIRMTATENGTTASQIKSVYDQVTQTKNRVETEVLANADFDVKMLESEYLNELRKTTPLAAEYASKVQNESTNGTRTWQEELLAKGFIGAGGYYWQIMKNNQLQLDLQAHINQVASAPLIYQAAGEGSNKYIAPIQDSELTKIAMARLSKVRDAYLLTREKSPLTIDMIEVSGRNADDDSSFLNFFELFPELALKVYSSAFIANEGDLIIRLSTIGIYANSFLEWMILFCLAAMVLGKVLTIFSGGAGLAAGMAGKFLGGSLGIFLKAGTGAMKLLLGAALLALPLTLFLQYVLPAIPLFKWLINIQQWGVMLFVSMIFAPLWMMGHTPASQQGWITEHNRNGYLMIVELVFRPLLMLCGLFAGIMLMHVADIAMKIAFPYLIGLGEQGTLGFIGATAIMLITTVLAFKLITRTFDLIHLVPDQVLERLGMGIKPLGDSGQDTTQSIGSAYAALGVGAVAGGIATGGPGRSGILQGGAADLGSAATDVASSAKNALQGLGSTIDDAKTTGLDKSKPTDQA